MSDTNTSDMGDSTEPERVVTINGEQADSIRYVRRGAGEDCAVDMTFARGETVIDTVRGVRGVDDVRELVGLQNAMRINRGGDAGVLAGETLSAHETIRHRDGSATAGRWTQAWPSDWLQRDPDAAVPAAPAEAETGRTTINGQVATAVLHDRPDGAAGYALTWKEGRKIVARMRDVGNRELVEALGEANAEAVQSSDGKGRLAGKSLHAHEGVGTEAPNRPRSRRAVSTEAVRGDEVAIPETEETNSVTPDDEPLLEAEPVARNMKATQAPEQTPPAADSERLRRERVLEEVRGQFRVTGGVYRFKDGERGVAFTDRGGRLTTASNDARAARAVAAMADGKGWESIKVAGHTEFRREAWLEARSRGLSVSGYKPSEQDLAELEERASKRQPNAAERTAGQGEQGRAVREQAPAAKASRQSGTAAVAGTLLEHGEAPYKHDPKESQSYRVRVDTERGERELWGVDLKRAVTESEAEPGDTVELERVDAQPVTVEANRRDEQGRVVGTETIATNRNGWEVRVTERRKVLDAVSEAFVAQHAHSDQARERLGTAMRQSLDERERAGSLPAVPVYDHRAPPRARRGRAPATQQGAERAPERSR